MPEGKDHPFDDADRPHVDDHEKEKIERLRRAMYSRKIAPTMHERERRDFETESAPVGEEWAHHESRLPGSMTAPRTIGLTRHIMRYVVIAAICFFLGA